MSERLPAHSEFEIRARADGGVMVEGHAAVFNSYSEDLGGFVEQVAPSAFNKTIKEADVRALINHDPMHVLGRTVSGTLRLSVDQSGLYYEIDMPHTQPARDLQESMTRGDITQSSFGFRAISDEWSTTSQGYPLRTLTEVSLHNGDVSPVTYPAYPETDSQMAFRSLVRRTGLEHDQIVAAAAAGELGGLISGNISAPQGAPAAEQAPAPLAVYERLLGLNEKKQPPRGR